MLSGSVWMLHKLPDHITQASKHQQSQLDFDSLALTFVRMTRIVISVGSMHRSFRHRDPAHPSILPKDYGCN